MKFANSKSTKTESSDRNSSSKPYLTIVNQDNRCIAKTLLGVPFNDRLNTIILEDTDCSDDEYLMPKREKNVLSMFRYADNDVCSCSKQTPSQSVEMTAPLNWQDGLVTPLQRLDTIFSLSHLADVKIIFPNCLTTFKAHKLILATASPVFERMLYGETLEAKTGEICLHDCVPDAVKWVLENLYTGKTNLEHVYLALPVYTVAQMYQISGVVDLCVEFLKGEMNVSNLSSIFKVARIHSEDHLMEACLKKITSSWHEVSKDRINRISEEMWQHMLKTDILPISEVDLFKALILWCQTKLEEKNESLSPSSVREILQKFLPNMRLFSMTADQFIDQVMPTKVFTSEECTMLLMRIRGIQVNLPAKLSCSSLPYSRIAITDDSLRCVVLHRQVESKKFGSTQVKKITLIENFTTSFPILIHHIQTHENNTIMSAEMTLLDNDDRVIGIAKPTGSQWKFIKPAFLYANKAYKCIVSKIVVYNKVSPKRDFCAHACDIRFKGSTTDHFLRLSFWPAHPRNS